MDFFEQLIQQLINGISLGSIYALIALGYTMVYGIIKLINFAHGDIYMVGAYVGFYAVTMTKMSISQYSSTYHIYGCYWSFRNFSRKNSV